MKQGLVIFLILLASFAYAQGNTSLDRAVEKQNWKKAFKLISNKINGIKLPEGNYNEVFDSLISNFKSFDCVIDAEWSKCGAKILIYPGQETIALKFNSAGEEIEKTFLVNTAKYKTHIRVFRLRFRIPEIDRKELVCVLMRDAENHSMISAMRDVCAWEVEEEKRRIHNSKVLFSAQIIDREEERSLPPLNFNCNNNQAKIEFSVTNNSEELLKVYWPSNLPKSDPLFRVSFHSYRPNLNVYEDTSMYLKNYEVITLNPNETIKTVQSINRSNIEQIQPNGISIHFYNKIQLDKLQRHSKKEGTIRIGYSAIDNGLSWEQDDVWKPTDSMYLFYMASYTITNICE